MSAQTTNLRFDAAAAPRTAEIIRAHPALQGEQRDRLFDRIKVLLRQRNAVLVAHYYTHSDLQILADATDGCVSDSLEMARFGADHEATTLVVAGVRFMGETAKILSPHKRVMMPTLEATCSLDLGCPADEFTRFCDQHPDRKVVVYANTSAAVKARADWVVTSGIALKIVKHLHDQGEKIIWAPDRHLGHYVARLTGADMLMWNGACIVHEEFKTEGLMALREQHPGAALLVHPESPAEVIEVADAVGSTSQLIKAATELPNDTFIVATDSQIFHKMRLAAPAKTFIAAPTGGVGATCRSCAHCPWMAMNDVQQLEQVLLHGGNEISIEESIRRRAAVPLQRMLDFAEQQRTQVLGVSNA